MTTNYYTTTEALAEALEGFGAAPVYMLLGALDTDSRMFAPVRMAYRFMTADLRSDWYDAHQDTSAVAVGVATQFFPETRALTTAELASVLRQRPDGPLAIEVGRWKAAPVALELHEVGIVLKATTRVQG